MLAVLGRSWVDVGGLGVLLGIYWRSWVALGPAACGPRIVLGTTLAILGCSWCLRVRAGAEKCEEDDYLENMFISQAGMRSAASEEVLRRSCGLCGRSLSCSWGALGCSWSFPCCTWVGTKSLQGGSKVLARGFFFGMLAPGAPFFLAPSPFFLARCHWGKPTDIINC